MMHKIRNYTIVLAVAGTLAGAVWAFHVHGHKTSVSTGNMHKRNTVSIKLAAYFNGAILFKVRLNDLPEKTEEWPIEVNRVRSVTTAASDRSGDVRVIVDGPESYQWVDLGTNTIWPATPSQGEDDYRDLMVLVEVIDPRPYLVGKPRRTLYDGPLNMKIHCNIVNTSNRIGLGAGRSFEVGGNDLVEIIPFPETSSGNAPAVLDVYSATLDRNQVKVFRDTLYVKWVGGQHERRDKPASSRE